MEQAEIIGRQFVETAKYRNWLLHAFSVMSNHAHLVVECDANLDAAKLIHDFKSYASRALKAAGHQPSGARWWTESGSRRLLPDAHAVEAAIQYVLNQHNPLYVWPSASASGACERPENT